MAGDWEVDEDEFEIWPDSIIRGEEHRDTCTTNGKFGRYTENCPRCINLRAWRNKPQLIKKSSNNDRLD